MTYTTKLDEHTRYWLRQGQFPMVLHAADEEFTRIGVVNDRWVFRCQSDGSLWRPTSDGKGIEPMVNA